MVLTPERIELHAVGFNAWSQLNLRPSNERIGARYEPEDIKAFTQVLTDVGKDFAIVDVQPCLTYTLVITGSPEVLTAGAMTAAEQQVHTPPIRQSYRLIAEAAEAAEAANGAVVVLKCDGVLRQYASLEDFCAGRPESSLFEGFSKVIQLVAYDVGFVALDSDGQVFTWGDKRYPGCLGRDVTTTPAHIPGLVHDLTDLPTGSITKIAANGYMIGALTAGEDLYCWGVQHRARTKPILDGLQDRPNLVDVDGKDIEDFGIGDSHVIVLTVEDELWVIGDNANGQLGIEAEEATTWTKVNIELEPDRSVVAVRAGPKCSFLIVEVSEKFSGDEGADARPKKRKRLSYPV